MKRKCGFTVVEISIVVALIALLTAIAIPSFINIRNTYRLHSCEENLRLIRHSLTMYKFTHNHTGEVPGLTLTELLPYLKSEPRCPGAGTYMEIGKVPYCTIHDDRATLNMTASDF